MQRKGPQRDAEKERFWRGVIRFQRRSGQSIREYCRANAIREPSFYAWRQVLKRRSAERASAVPRRHAQAVAPKARCGAAGGASFVPVRIAAEVPPWGAAAIELALPSGATLRLPRDMEPAAIAAVVSAWEHARC